MGNDGELEKLFHRAIINIYERLAKCNYRATYFLHMVGDCSGVNAAKGLLNNPNIQDGFENV